MSHWSRLANQTRALLLAIIMLLVSQTPHFVSFIDASEQNSILGEFGENRNSGTVFTGNGTQWQTANAASFDMSSSSNLYPISNDSFLFAAADAGGNCLKIYSHSNLTVWNASVDSNYVCPASPSFQYGPTIDNRVYMSALCQCHFPGTPNSGVELFAYNITNNTLYLVEDINTETYSGGNGWGSEPLDLEAVGSTLYFKADGSSATGSELWAHNTNNSTSWLVADINPGAGDSYPRYILPIGTSIVFVADDGTNGKELWTYETTNDSYWRVSDINPSGNGLNQLTSRYSAVIGTRLMFWADDDGATGNELWAYETTNTTHWQVADINSGSGDSYSTRMITRDGSRMYFSADDGINGEELWAYEATNDSVWLLADICSGCDSYPTQIAVMGDQLIFSADSTDEGSELFIYNFSNNTAWMRANLYQFGAGTPSSSPEIIAVTGTQLLITANERKFISPTSYERKSLFVYETANDTIWWNGKLGLTAGSSYAQVLGGTLNIGTEVIFALGCGTSAGTNCPNGLASGKQLWVYTPSNVTIPDDFTPSGGHRDEPPTGGFGGVWGGGSGDGSGSGSGDGISLSPASTTVTLTNNTAMTPITYNWTGSSGTGTSNGNGTVWQVTDINSGSLSSIVSPKCTTILVGDTLYFSAREASTGDELWAHDTSNGTTWQVADINSAGDSDPGQYMAILVGDTIYFSADDGSTGIELWAHDTSNQSTWRVADINSGGSSNPGEDMAILVGDTIYFDADDGSTGIELWAHDTSNHTTWQVADINSGGNSDPGQYMAILVGDTIYFGADDGSTGIELWAHDTSNGTTWQVADINSGGSSDPGDDMAILVGDTIYFDADDGSTGIELWAHDTSNHTTWQVADINSGGSSYPGDAILVGDTIYFSARDASTGQELWAHDTSNSSTWQVADINSGGNSDPGQHMAILVGDTIYFSARDASTGQELWAHDISNGTTWQVADISSGGNGGNPGTNMAILVGDIIYFDADDWPGSNRHELWAHDTSNGTTWQVADINSAGNSDPGYYMAILVGDAIYFDASGSDGGELWAVGSGNGVSGPSNGPVTSATCEISPTLPTGISIAQGTCTISGTPTVEQSATSYTVWANESGSSATATVDITVESGIAVLSPTSTTVVLTNNTAMTPITHNWIGGSAGGTTTYNGNETSWVVADINSGGAENINDITVIGTRLFFSANDGTNGSELWTHETTNDSTWMVPSGSFATSFIAVGTRLFFQGYDGTNGSELWAHETTNDSTWMVADINSGGNANPSPLSALGTRLFFTADDGTNGRELWAHEMTNDSTWMVADINSGGSANIGDGIAVGTRFYFNAYDGGTSCSGGDLWAYEATNESIWKVEDSNNGGPNCPGSFISMGTRIYFRGLHDDGSSEIWAHETTNETTWEATDVSVGADGMGYNHPSHVTAIGSQIIFTVKTSSSNPSSIYWIHDTTNGTTWGGGLIDIAWSVVGEPFAYLGTRIFFQIDTASSGDELGAFEITNETAWMVDDIWNVGTASSSPSYIVTVGPHLFFQASNGTHAGGGISGLFAHDPIGVTVSGPNNGPVTNATCEISPALPAGLSMAQGTCTLSGTPTVTQSSTAYTLWVNDSGISDSATIDITIEESNNPVITPDSISVVLTRTIAMTPISFSNSGGVVDDWEVDPALPDGLSIASDGTISGTPTTVQTSADYTVWANNSDGEDSSIVTITVNEFVPEPPSITPVSTSLILTRTVEMTPQSFTNSGGVVDDWQVDPTLPDGLSIASDGTISGTPTTVQTSADYTVWANNTGGADSSTVTITVNELLPDPPSILPASTSLILTRTVEMTPQSFTNSGGVVDDWQVDPALPDGLSFDSADGTISGTPTTVQIAAIYTVWANNTGGEDSSTVTITVEEYIPDPPEIDYGISTITLTQYLEMAPLTTSNTGGEVANWTISPELSLGLLFNTEDGTISGIPITNESAITYTIWANNTGGSGSDSIEITIEEPPEGLIVSSSSMLLVRDVDVPLWIFVYSGGDITTWEISPDLPPGLIFDIVNQSMIGAPTTILDETEYTIWATGDGISDNATFTIEILEDTDGDGMPDDLGDRVDTGLIEDLDDDADGIPDGNESSSLPSTDPLLPDTDGDGVCDGASNVTIRGVQICEGGPDDFPTDPSAWKDTDGDGDPDDIEGDSTSEPPLVEDLDDDNDGIPDENETAEDSLTDSKLPDTDGDGYCDGSIDVTYGDELICTGGPDAFPDDPAEWNNTDATCTTECIADLIGDNADLDDDGDQASDLDEIAAGTDPLDPLDFPTDDADGDGWTDANENLCGTDMLDNMSTPSDYDGDGWCDATDTDDDDDGWFDSSEDDCGTDSLDEKDIPGDADGDGICDALDIEPKKEVDGGFPWWLCSLIFLALIIILPLIMRMIDDAMPVNTTVKPEVAGTGTRDDPFILTPIKGIEPGEKVLSKETITIINMTSKLKVPIIDLNESDNGDRFKMVGGLLSDERVAMIIATKEGTMKFLMSFDDSSNPTLGGGTFESVLKVGSDSVYFNWDVTVKSDPNSAKKAKKTKAKKTKAKKEAKAEEKAEAAEEKETKAAEEKETKAAEEKETKAAEEKETKAEEKETKAADKPVSKAEKKLNDLKRIKGNAEKIDFATIGIASASDKDNLQELVGIGPFIEEKLNALGIYKFKQLSKMTSQIETDVNEAIEFFPGRVKRDEWKKQAKKLV